MRWIKSCWLLQSFVPWTVRATGINFSKVACEWFVRLKAKDISDAEQNQHSDWMNESPDHQQAHRDLNQQWEQMDELKPWALDEVDRLESRFEQSQRREAYPLWHQSHKRKHIGLALVALVGVSLAYAAFMALPWFELTTNIDYQTQPGEQRKVVLPDGSLLHLNTATRVNIEYRTDRREIELLSGEALIDVVQIPGRPFVAYGSGHNIVGMGATFNLRLLNAALEITVIEGQIAVRQHAGNRLTDPDTPLTKTIVLNTGQAVVINTAGRISKVSTADVEVATAWDRGLLIFDGMSLRKAAEKLSRYMVADIRVAAGEPNYVVTGQIQVRDQEAMLRQFAKLANVTPVRQSPELIVLYSASQ